MADEPERRFLLADGFSPVGMARESMLIIQDYLPDTGSWAVRVRWTTSALGTVYHLTLKSPKSAVTNNEHEIEISREAYMDILASCAASVTKTRYIVRNGVDDWEVDVYHHPKADPPMIAEIELASEEQSLSLPEWIGREVTGDRWYSNAQIAARLTQIDKETVDG